MIDALWRDNVDFAQIIKDYNTPSPTRPASTQPATNCTVVDVNVLNGEPDPAHLDQLRRAPEPHHADGDAPVHPAHQWPHQSLTIEQEGKPGIKRTPAMAAGVSDRIWSLTDIAALLN